MVSHLCPTMVSVPLCSVTKEPLRLLMISEVRFLREALTELLQRDSRVTVLGQCADLSEAIAETCVHQPEIVLLDANFRNGTDAIRRLHAAVPKQDVVVLAVAETAEDIISWAEAGAIGFVPPTTKFADLVNILLGIKAGSQTCSGQVVSGLLRHLAREAYQVFGISGQRPLANLTRREREISQLIGAGLSNKEIARRLGIGLATTKSHVHNMLSKMNVQRRGQAAHLLAMSGGGLGHSD